MRVCYDEADVYAAMEAVDGAVLVDRFLESAVELDIDALCDGDETYVAAVMEHVEEAGIHSGDSSCVLPAPSDSPEIRDLVRRLGPALGVVGLLNVQLAIAAGEVYVLEVNPRASRTVPYASKATGINLVDAACRLAAGATLAELELPPEGSVCAGYHVKAAVLPFVRFPGADPVLGPEMRSTGEVMASGADFATAFAKAERAAGRRLPSGGRAFLSVRDADKVAVVPVAQALAALGFDLVATIGTAAALELAGIAVERVEKGDRRRRARPRGPRRPRRQHAAGAKRPARRLRDPRGGGRRAGALHHDARGSARGRGRDRRRPRGGAGRRSRRAMQASRSRRRFVRRRERLLVVGVEAVGAYTLVRVERGSLEPGVPGQFFMLEAPGRLLPRPFSLCTRSPGRARLPRRPGRPRDAGDRRARAGRPDRGLRPARERVPARRRRGRCSSAAGSASRRSRTSRRRSSIRPRSSASGPPSTPRRRLSSRTPRS